MGGGNPYHLMHLLCACLLCAPCNAQAVLSRPQQERRQAESVQHQLGGALLQDTFPKQERELNYVRKVLRVLEKILQTAF